MVAEHRVDGGALVGVAHVGGGAVGVDVLHILRLQTGLLQRQRHALGAALSAGTGGGDVEGVVVVSTGQNFSVDLRAASLGVLQCLQHQRAAALAHDEAVAVLVKGLAGVSRVVVVLAQRLRRRQRGDGHVAHDALAAHGHHGVRRAGVQQQAGHVDGVDAGGAGGVHRQARTAQVVGNGDLAGSHVAQNFRDEPGGDLLAGGGIILHLGLGDLRHAVHGRAHDKTGAEGVQSAAAHLNGLLRRREGVQTEGGEVLGVGLGDKGVRVKVLHLTGEAHGELRCVKVGDGGDAADAGGQVLPVGLHADADGGHCAHAGDDDAFVHFIQCMYPHSRVHFTGIQTKSIIGYGGGGVKAGGGKESGRKITKSAWKCWTGQGDGGMIAHGKN